MAQISQQKRYKDLDLNFTAHPVRKDVNVLTDDNAIISSVRNLLYTNFYERLFQPDVGSGLRALLFENMDSFTASKINRAINETISNYEPRVKITNLKVSPSYDDNAYSCELEFLILNKSQPAKLTFFLERVR